MNKLMMLTMGGGLLSETSLYKNRVEADGGSIIDIAYTNECFKLIRRLGISALGYVWISPSCGIKKDGSNNISKAYDLFGINDLIQDTANKYPLFVSEDVNFKNRPTFNVTSKSFKRTSTTLQAYINLFSVTKLSGTLSLIEHSATAVTNQGFAFILDAGAADGTMLVNRDGAYHSIGAATNDGGKYVGQFAIGQLEYNATDQNTLVNNITRKKGTITGTLRANTEVTTQLNLFARNQTSLYTTGNSADFILTKQLTPAKRNSIYYHLRKYYAPNNFELFDESKMHNTIYLDRYTRNPFASFKFNYSGTTLQLKATSSLYPSYPQWSYLTIFVNGVYNQRIQFDNTIDAAYTEITLPDGNKVVEIVEGLMSKPSSTIIGTTIYSLVGDQDKFSLIEETTVPEKIVILADSIGNGASADYPAQEAFGRLFKLIDSVETAFLGYGFAQLAHFAANSTLINDTVSKIQTMLANSTVKKVYIQQGTNDYGVAGLASATFLSYYANLVDAINAADPSIIVYCQSPFSRASETSLMGEYRTGIQAICTARQGWTTYLHGPDIVSFNATNFNADNVHLTTAGHLAAHDYLDNIIL